MRLIIQHNHDVVVKVGEKMYLGEGMVIGVTSIISNPTSQKTIAEGEVMIDFMTEEVEGVGEVDRDDAPVLVEGLPLKDNTEMYLEEKESKENN
jgi:hypothetical protein